jgi:hypothetical protein
VDRVLAVAAGRYIGTGVNTRSVTDSAQLH